MSTAVRNFRAVQATTEKKPAVFSFFSGAGFLDLGFEQSGFEVVFVNELHPPFLTAYRFARKKLGIGIPQFGYFERDIASLLEEKERKRLHLIVTQAKQEHALVGFIGGPPCPDFSIAGKNKGRNGTSGILSQTYADLISQQQPDFFLFENVKGLWGTKVHRAFYEDLKVQLCKSGYALSERLINSLEYGAPQDRDRLILLGFNRYSCGAQVTQRITKFPWLKYAKYNKVDAMSRNWIRTEPYKEASVRKAPKGIIRELTVEHWFRRNDVDNHPNSRHFFKPRAGLVRFQSIAEGDDSRKSFKRLHRWRYSPTAAYGHNEVHIHPYKPRRITSAEALAIQSLPKSFVISPDITLSDQFKAVGNGVPYLAAKSIALSVMSFLKSL